VILSVMHHCQNRLDSTTKLLIFLSGLFYTYKLYVLNYDFKLCGRAFLTFERGHRKLLFFDVEHVVQPREYN
jgi:hypothetical protein